MRLKSKIQYISQYVGDKLDIEKIYNRMNDWYSGDKENAFISKQIFFCLTIKDNGQENFEMEILEQLQIAFQILINRGYEIRVSSVKDKDIEICHDFINVFKSNAIQYIQDTDENALVIHSLYQSEFIITMDTDYLIYSLILDKVFISLFSDEDLLERLGLQNVFIKSENFHAGVLLEKIEYLTENIIKIKDNSMMVSNKDIEQRSMDESCLNNNEDKITLADRMNIYKREFKTNIQALIEKGLVKAAKDMVSEYEKMVEGDIDIYSIKGVIAMMEGDMMKAENILQEGINFQPRNSDLLYNLAYLYESKGKYITAYRQYKKIAKNVDEEIAKDAKVRMKELEMIKNVKEYNQRKKVLFIAHIFPPVGGSGVQRSLKFVKYLRNFGWEPIVLTVGETKYPLKDETMISEIPEEIEVVRIDELTSISIDHLNQLPELYRGVVNNNNLMESYSEELNKSKEHFGQLIFIPDTYIIWAKEVLNQIEDKIDLKEIEMLYTTSGPYSDHIIGYYLKKMHNKPWVADFRDEWTNNPYANYDKDSLRYKIQVAMEANIIDMANKIITTTPKASENYRAIFAIENNKVITITNGYDEDDFRKVMDGEVKNKKFTIMHNGLLYSIRTPTTFLHAVDNLIKKGLLDKKLLKIVFSWTDNDNYWKNYVKELGLSECVEFVGYLSHEKSIQKAKKADVLLLIVGPGEQNSAVYPGKVFEYLRLCKPILALSPLNSVVSELIENTKRGYNSDFNDIEHLEENIYDMYLNWKNNTFESSQLLVDDHIIQYERKNLTQKLSRVFDEIMLQDSDEILYDNRDEIQEMYELENYMDNTMKDKQILKKRDIQKYILVLFEKKEYQKIVDYLQENIFKREKYQEVVDICNYWKENVDKHTGIIYFFMGVACNGLGQFEEAINCHKKSLELDESLAAIKYKDSYYKRIYDENKTECIGCGKNKYRIVNVTNQSIMELNLGVINPLRIWVKCEECGLIYANPMPSEESMNKYYSLITRERRSGGRYTNVDDSLEFLINMSNRRLEKIERYNDGTGKLLDVGTGIGVFTGVALERGWEAIGLEFTLEDCQYAKDNFGLTLIKKDFYDFDGDERYDVVTLFEVIEHLRHPFKDICKLNQLIKYQGILVLATPIQDSLHAKKAKDQAGNWNVVSHLSYFTREVLINYLKAAGFEIIETNYSPEGLGRLEFYCRKIIDIDSKASFYNKEY